ncbi:MAG: acyltransferase [Clostridia bacterium]|nr:acyltransferase [Clostridia bacterium]
MYLLISLALVVICFIGASVAPKGEIFSDYMSKDRTTSIKGVFAYIIVLSHMLQYISTSGADNIARAAIVGIGQLMVTMFFFYSGYGIMESCKAKPGYMKGFFKNRIIKTLVHFDIAIVLFIILNYFIGKEYSLKRTLLAFTGWTSIGNSNWFVFCTLALYLITLLCFAVFAKKRGVAFALTLVLTLGLIVLLREVKHDYWWYNTLLCYPLGMLWSLIREGVEKAFSRSIAGWWAAMISLLVLFVGAIPVLLSGLGMMNLVTFPRWLDFQSFYMIFACIFCLVVVVSQMRLRTDNRILRWLGVNSFSIYILQRLPMNVLRHFGLHKDNLIFIPLALCGILIISPLFTWLIGKLDGVLFPRKAKNRQEIAK